MKTQTAKCMSKWMRMSRVVYTGFACGLLSASLPALADTTSIDTCPFTITAHGVYHVTQDLTCPAGGITITANDVELRLDGHTLDGGGSGEFGIRVAGSNDSVFGERSEQPQEGADRETGTVTNFFYDVFSESLSGAPTSDNLFANLTATMAGNFGIALENSRNSTVINCTANNNQHGIVVANFSSNNTVIANTTLQNGLWGISVFASNNNIFIANQADRNQAGGIFVTLSSSGNVFRANKTNRNSNGIFVDASSTMNLFQANKAHGNPVFDLEDNNPACDANTWKSNSFDTANQPCIH